MWFIFRPRLLANWWCISRYAMLVGLHGFRCSWCPKIFHVCFPSSVCLTRDLAHFKKKFLPGVAIFMKGNTSICLTVLSLDLTLCWLCHLTFRNPKIQIFPTLLAEKGTHLGHWKTFLVFLIANFETLNLNCLWFSLVCHLSIPHHLLSQTTIWTDEIIYAWQNLRAVIC